MYRNVREWEIEGFPLRPIDSENKKTYNQYLLEERLKQQNYTPVLKVRKPKPGEVVKTYQRL